MIKLTSYIILVLLIVFICPALATAEDITITTYYPSPYGVYNSLGADKLGVGDMVDGVAGFTSTDVGLNSGELLVASKVGINLGAQVSPASELEVNGTVRANLFQSGSDPGLTKTISITEEGGATCTIIITNGIYTGGTC